MTKALDQRLNEAADLASNAAPLLDDFVNGDENTVIHGRAGDYPSQAKAAKDTRTTITTMVSDTLGEITDHAALVTKEADRSKTEADRAASEATQAGSDADRADTAAGKAEGEAGKAKQSATAAASTAQHFVDQTVPDAESGLSQSAAGYIAETKAEADKAIGQADKADAAATNAEAQAATATAQAGAATDSAGLAEAAATHSGESAVTSKSEADRAKLEADRAKAAADSVPDMPDQGGKAGKFLGTDGTAYSWKDVPPELPAMAGQGGKLLGTDGSKPAWRDPPVALPDQAGHDNEFLCTDGATADWQPIPEGLPPQTGNDGKFLQTDGTDASWQEMALGVPVGTFLPLGMKATTMGYLAADGQQYTKADYPALWDVAHKNQWEGVTDTTFIVPDWRGLGVTGYDPTGIIDPDNVGRGFLTKQTDAIRNITGTTGSVGYSKPNPPIDGHAISGAFKSLGAPTWQGTNYKVDVSAYSGSNINYISLDVSRVVPTAAVNRINNINALWVVKAYDVVLEPEQLQAKAVIDQVNSNAAELLNVKEKTDTIGYVLIDFGTVNKNSRYVKPNPFGNDTPVICVVELLYNNKWFDPKWIYSSSGNVLGTSVSSVDGGEVVVQTAKNAISTSSPSLCGAAYPGGGTAAGGSSAPCRVHVWRVGI